MTFLYDSFSRFFTTNFSAVVIKLRDEVDGIVGDRLGPRAEWLVQLGVPIEGK